MGANHRPKTKLTRSLSFDKVMFKIMEARRKYHRIGRNRSDYLGVVLEHILGIKDHPEIFLRAPGEMESDAAIQNHLVTSGGIPGGAAPRFVAQESAADIRSIIRQELDTKLDRIKRELTNDPFPKKTDPTRLVKRTSGHPVRRAS